MDEIAIRKALSGVADEFGGAAHDTIMFENFGKHLFELKLIADHLPANGRLLDVGGGVGVNLMTLRKLGYGGAALHLMDQFEEYTDDNRMGDSREAQQLSSRNNIEVLTRNILEQPSMPFEDSSLDMVTFFDVIEHLPTNPFKILKEVYRVLVPGGTLLLSGPNARSFMKRVKMLQGIHPYIPFDLWIQDKYYSHFREYMPEEYAAVLLKCNFTVKEVKRLAEPSVTRARNLYYNRHHSAISPVSLALTAIAAIELAVPGLRSTVYCIASKK